MAKPVAPVTTISGFDIGLGLKKGSWTKSDDPGGPSKRPVRGKWWPSGVGNCARKANKRLGLQYFQI